MKHWKRDILLILVLLILAAVLWIALRPGDVGSYAVVSIHGKEYGRYPLDKDLCIPIGEDEYNVLCITGGEVYISDANCGDYTCIRTGKISREGEQIICLPHQLIITITGSLESEIDASTN